MARYSSGTKKQKKGFAIRLCNAEGREPKSSLQCGGLVPSPDRAIKGGIDMITNEKRQALLKKIEELQKKSDETVERVRTKLRVAATVVTPSGMFENPWSALEHIIRHGNYERRIAAVEAWNDIVNCEGHNWGLDVARSLITAYDDE